MRFSRLRFFVRSFPCFWEHAENPYNKVIPTYLLYQVEKAKKDEQAHRSGFGNFLQAMREKFGNWASVEDFLKQRDKIWHSLKKEGHGYVILSDPLGLRNSVLLTPNNGKKSQIPLLKLWEK